MAKLHDGGSNSAGVYFLDQFHMQEKLKKLIESPC
jgi:hypothetical protein